MAPAYKLIYFPLTGLGEPIRYLLSYGGIEFEDCRIPREDWSKYKADMPFGQLPVLEHNGKRAHQSLAICKYLAKQMGLVGKDDWEDLEIDAMVFTINDLRLKIANYHFQEDKKVKEQLKTVLFNETIPFYLQRLDKSATDNNGHLVAGRLTWADIYFVGLLYALNYIAETDIVANYPNVLALKNKIENLPKIKEWIEKRPKGLF